jgi:uncharacterized protein (TIGR00251 family)
LSNFKERVIEVKVIPNARKNLVEIAEGRYKVYLNVPPVDGKANNALIEILSEYFKVQKNIIEIIAGKKAGLKSEIRLKN